MTDTTPLALTCYLAEVERQATGLARRAPRRPPVRDTGWPTGRVHRLAALVAGLHRRTAPAAGVRP
jgi:hypothetical protein